MQNASAIGWMSYIYSQTFPSEAKDATSENVPHGYMQVDIPEKSKRANSFIYIIVRI